MSDVGPNKEQAIQALTVTNPMGFSFTAKCWFESETDYTEQKRLESEYGMSNLSNSGMRLTVTGNAITIHFELFTPPNLPSLFTPKM